MRRRVVFLNDFEDLVASLLVRYRVHWLYLPTTARIFLMTIEAPLRGIVIRSSCMNPSSRTATLRISKGLVAVSSVGGVALQAIIHAANLDDRW